MHVDVSVDGVLQSVADSVVVIVGVDVDHVSVVGVSVLVIDGV